MDDCGEESKRYYIREEMMKQAYVIAVGEEEFKGVASEYQDTLMANDIAPAEAFIAIDEIVGAALSRIEK